MISIIIPTYRNPEYLDICLKSCIEQQHNKNEIIVAVDGFIEESQEVLDKYKKDIKILDLGENQGMQMALNLAVMNATNEKIFIVKLHIEITSQCYITFTCQHVIDSNSSRTQCMNSKIINIKFIFYKFFFATYS